ncbi:MAG TPA: hypothetical protein VMS17_04150 [Gemmataceae bacterium]|nr:hypothetical protein [Gemmataceae bacterium]
MRALPQLTRVGTKLWTSCAHSGLHCLVCIFGALVPAAIGQAQTTPTDVPQVEMYVGLRRIDPGGQARAPAAQPEQPPVSPTPPAVEANPQSAPPPLSAPAAAVPLAYVVFDPPLDYQELPPPSGTVVQADSAVEDAGVGEPVEQQAATAKPEQPAAFVEAPAAVQTVHDDAPSGTLKSARAAQDSWLSVAAAPLAGALAILAVALMLYAVVRLSLSRRRRFGTSAVRVERVSVPGPPQMAAPAPKPDAVPVPPVQRACVAPARPAEEAVGEEVEKRFDFAPSYADEARAAEEARCRAVDALLQELFQQDAAPRRRRSEQAAVA